MSHFDSSSLQFAASFIDAVTIRPFYADLKRLKQQASRFGSLPGHEVEEIEVESGEAANAA